jgi:hypothetical protein
MTACIAVAVKALVLAAAIDASAAAGRDIAWVGGYDAALERARASNVPALVIFEAPSKPAAIWTVEGARVLDIMRSRCVFARIDPGNTQALPAWYRGAGSPVAAVVDPAGGVQVSWAALPPMEEVAGRLKEVWTAAALAEADKAAAGGDDGRAVAAWWDVLRVGARGDGADRAREGLAEAGRRGRARIGEANPLLRARRFLEAVRMLEKIERDYAGTETARLAGDRKAEFLSLPSVAREFARQEAEEKRRIRLEEGEAALAADDFETAREAFQALVDEDAGSPEASRASEHLAELTKEMNAVVDERQKLMDRECRMWMSYADTLTSQKRTREAGKYYSKIIEAWPDSAYAETARSKMAKLR